MTTKAIDRDDHSAETIVTLDGAIRIGSPKRMSGQYLAPVTTPGTKHMPTKEQQCAKCGATEAKMSRCANGHLCDSCLQVVRTGRDVTTQIAIEQRSLVLNNSPLERLDENLGSESLSLPMPLISPERISQDAAAHRNDLLSRAGTDCVALAMDAVNNIESANPVETMLAHQMAAAHKAALECMDKGFLETELDIKVKLMGMAARMMAAFQSGAVVLHRLQTGGHQTVRVEHVTVNEGGALIGKVQTSRGEPK